MNEISIQQVLAEIREGASGPFLIRYVRGTGKNRGSIKTVAKAVYGRSKGRGGNRSESSKANPLHIYRGTIPMTDSECNQYLTPFISHIIQFNSFKVKH